MRVVLLAPCDRDRLCVRINAVLDEFGDGFQRITLRERDDPDCVPVIPDAQLAAVLTLGFHDDTRLTMASPRDLFLPARLGGGLRWPSYFTALDSGSDLNQFAADWSRPF